MEQSTLDALGDYTRSNEFSDAERAALGAAVALTREPRALPPALQEQLDAYYDEGERVEIIAVVALFNAINRMSNALRLDAMPEPPCEP